MRIAIGMDIPMHIAMTGCLARLELDITVG